jgi:tetratricopeptide (TPR) repeat protein
VARGSQHLKKRPHAPSGAPAARTRADERRSRKLEEQGMFFPMLRRQARWVFVLLAVVFAGGFIFFGVGSGSGGLGDVLTGWLNTGSSATGGPSISKLEKRTAANPKDAQALRQLATAYQADQRQDDATRVLERYTVLRPKDGDALQELAGLYTLKAQELGTEGQAIQASTPSSAASTFAPPPTSKFGQAFSDPAALGDPIDQAQSTIVSQKLNVLQQQIYGVYGKLLETQKKVVALDPTDATNQYQLAQVAQALGDTKVALKAYRDFLQISPDDPLAPQAKQAIAQLAAASTASAG